MSNVTIVAFASRLKNAQGVFLENHIVVNVVP
jgi:hypothetical protein